MVQSPPESTKTYLRSLVVDAKHLYSQITFVRGSNWPAFHSQCRWTLASGEQDIHTPCKVLWYHINVCFNAANVLWIISSLRAVSDGKVSCIFAQHLRLQMPVCLTQSSSSCNGKPLMDHLAYVAMLNMTQASKKFKLNFLELPRRKQGSVERRYNSWHQKPFVSLCEKHIRFFFHFLDFIFLKKISFH